MPTSTSVRRTTLSTGAKATVAGYCAHMLMVWIDHCDRMVGFGIDRD